MRRVALPLAVLAAACSGSGANAPAGTALRTPVELRRVVTFTSGSCPASLTAPSGGVLLPLRSECLALGPAALTVSRAAGVAAEPDSEFASGAAGWHVTVTLVAAQRKAFTDLTRSAVGSRLAFVADGAVLSSPTVHEAITGGTMQIAVPSEAEARALAARLAG